MNNRHPWQLKKSKSWGPFWIYQLNSTANFCQFSLFTLKMGQMGCIGSAVQLIAPKRPPGFGFFQLSWVPIIHFSLFPWRPMPPNITDIINCSQAVCAVQDRKPLQSCFFYNICTGILPRLMKTKAALLTQFKTHNSIFISFQ